MPLLFDTVGVVWFPPMEDFYTIFLLMAGIICALFHSVTIKTF